MPVFISLSLAIPLSFIYTLSLFSLSVITASAGTFKTLFLSPVLTLISTSYPILKMLEILSSFTTTFVTVSVPD
jgi:hypothetical protein